MLRSSAGLLRNGVVRRAAESIFLDSATITELSHGQLCYSTRHFRRSGLRSLSNYRTATFSIGRSPTDSSYFNSTQPEHPSPSRPSDALKLERYLPPLIDAELHAQTDSHQALFTAIQHLDADLSWHLYKQLGKARRSIPTSVIPLLITLQCRKPVRSSRANPIDSRAAVSQVCDRVLQLCRDRLSLHPAGSSTNPASSSRQDDPLSTLSAPLSMRLLYLLVVEEEQIAASKPSQKGRRRRNLAAILDSLSANIESRIDLQGTQIDVELRGRLAATLARLGSTDAAFSHLERVVQQVAQSDHDTWIDPRPFDQLLSALAKQRSDFGPASHLLPSPVDVASRRIQENHPIIRALRLTLSSDVQASKANIHKCLQALDSATLWWLLPFELDGNHLHASSAREHLDDRLPLKPKWHPWQATSSDSISISQDSLDSFAERVALVLAQRGILQPSLHIIDGLQPSRRGQSSSNTKVPDHDFFTVVLEKLAQRMATDSDSEARTSLDMHRGLSADLHLAIKVYTLAHSIGVDLDSRLNEAVIKAMASSLPFAVADLGPERSRHTKIKGHIANRNEKRGSKDALKQYLRQFTSIVLSSDPDLSKGSLSFPAQTTLLGLHMRTRDYSFSKRVYKLMRIRDPDQDLWSSDPQTGSLRLRNSALHPLGAPDHDGFMWLFVQSLGSSNKAVFAVQLYLDWTAGGNTIPSRLNAIFVRGLLRAGLIPIVRRILQDLEGDRSLLPARLARSLVISFADAGFPDLAMEMVLNVSQLTASTYQLRSAISVEDEPSASRQLWVLTSTLKLMSIALDRSSRAAPSTEGALQGKVLRLFEDFRLGMTHHLFMSAAQSDHAPQAHASAAMTLRDVRMAYNACMRASLSVLSSPFRASEAGERGDTEASWSAIEATCLHVEGLFKELTDLGVDPDPDSWDLRLTSSLHGCLTARDEAGRERWLRTALKVLEEASEQTYKADGPLHAFRPDWQPTRTSTAPPKVETSNRSRCTQPSWQPQLMHVAAAAISSSVFERMRFICVKARTTWMSKRRG